MEMKWVNPKAPKPKTHSVTLKWISADNPPGKNGCYIACSKAGDIWMPFYHTTVKTWWLGGLNITNVVWYWAEMPETPKEREQA